MPCVPENCEECPHLKRVQPGSSGPPLSAKAMYSVREGIYFKDLPSRGTKQWRKVNFPRVPESPASLMFVEM